MATVADTQQLREALDRFVRDHVSEEEAIVSARILRDDEGSYVSVTVEPDRNVELPTEFEGLRVVVTERAPGYVAAGPLR